MTTEAIQLTHGTVTITSPDHALNLLRQVIRAPGKGTNYRHVDPVEAAAGSVTCTYWRRDPDDADAGPDCIVGHVGWLLGYRPTMDLDGEYLDDAWEETAAGGLVEQGMIKAPPIVGEILGAAQAAQDQGLTWGAALAAAEQVARAYHLGRTAGISEVATG